MDYSETDQLLYKLRVFDGDGNNTNTEPERGYSGHGRTQGRGQSRGNGYGRPPRGGPQAFRRGSGRDIENEQTMHAERENPSRPGRDGLVPRGRRRSKRGGTLAGDTGRDLRGDSARLSSLNRQQARNKNSQRGARSHSTDRNYGRNSESDTTQSDTNAKRKDGEIRTPKDIKPMFYKRLIEFSNPDNDPDDILFKVTQSKSGFIELVTTSFERNANDIFRLIALVIKAQNVHTLRTFLQNLIDCNFLQMLQLLLSKLVIKDSTVRNLWRDLSKLESLGTNMCDYLIVLMGTLPSSLVHCLGVINNLKQVFQTYNLSNDLSAVDLMFTKVNIEKQKAASEREARQEKGYKRKPASTEPPDNFREISIFPTLLDIHMDEKPFLRANKTKGKYDSLDTYLDIQFRLLREDYMQPLRNGISEYRSCIKEGQSVTRLRNIRIYSGVQIQRPKCSSMGINHILQFDNAPFKRMNWATSRRLLHGSLVCLSSDNFETVCYAIVAHRNPQHLSDGCIEVHFEDKTGGIMDIQKNDTFVMAETSAYFEAYRYILEGLQEMKDTMPLSKYIIECKTDIQPPQYLLESSYPDYDFSCMLLEKHKGNSTFQVLNERQWPKHTDLGLDTTQYLALKTAVTKELAIIQGPPGTGKTYVGLKIAELLLANDMFWKTKENSSPILVVCYTNHALDQFLEGILQNCKPSEIVRIGGRCKNETLENCLLRKKKQNRREKRSRSFAVLQRERDCRKELRCSEREILQIGSKLKKTSLQILRASQLKIVIPDEHLEDLIDQTNESNKMSDWLGFCPLPEEITGNDSSHSIKDVWKIFILEEIEGMQPENKIAIEDVWGLQLENRAELYKCWHMECLVAISQLKNVNLSIVEKKFKKMIFNYSNLQHYCTDLISKSQLQQLIDKSKHKSHVVERWLYITCDADDIPAIREVIDRCSGQSGDQNTAASGEDDLEEERALDNDADDMFYDCLDDQPNEKQKKSKKKTTDGEWVIQWNARKNAQSVKHMLRSAKPITQAEIDQIENVWDLVIEKRVSLYTYWLNEYRRNLKDLVKAYEHTFTNATNELQEVRDQETFEILGESLVMGMTTTGAAKYRKLLERVKPQIIIVEEAAEVLESHIITTLNSNCKHLILIGDHKQLRPSTTVYELSKRYDMDISLFERMVRNNVPCVTLEEQHRMRPEISVLMKRDKLYPRLRDHDSVRTYESVRGVDANVFFISHREPELESSESTSYSNPHEAKYIAKLCRYFLNQGYPTDKITVITPYMGQVMLLRKEMPKNVFDGVRITAVDNFQGEENDIILLSLVRSNEKYFKRNPIGFVGIENRICVSLSRAKKGLYVLGNFNLIEAHSPLWEEIIADMKDEKAIGKGLVLRCSNHPIISVCAETAKDFDKVSEGGCNLPCGGTLPCTHPCPRSCHIVDMEHKFVTCYKPCQKTVCHFGHKCTKLCQQPCGNCLTQIEKTVPMCGHIVTMACHIDPATWTCKEACREILGCGHKCPKRCGECTRKCRHELKCNEDIWKKLPCGHSVSIKCYQSSDGIVCNKECRTTLNCGHQCSGTCGICFGGKIHKQCKGTCQKILPCGHTCPYPCSEICPPCSQRCGWKCSHKKECKKKCPEQCDDCNETCMFQCVHIRCEHDCHKACAQSGCDRKCNKKLPNCDHQCQSLCGETCVCFQCNSNKVKTAKKDFDETSRFMQLPDCKCIFEVGELDRHMNKPTTARRTLTKACPFCNKIIRTHIKRYSNIMKEIRRRIENCYEGLRKSSTDNKKTMALNASISKLEDEGLKKEYIDDLRQPLNSHSTWINDVTKKKCDSLQEVLRVEKYIEKKKQAWQVDLSKFDKIMTVDQLQKAITLKDRKYTSEQLWMEVTAETKRLELAVKLAVLHEYMDRFKTGHLCKHLLDDTTKLLSLEMFDDCRQRVVISAINLVTPYLSGDAKQTGDFSLMVKLSEVKMEAARQSLQCRLSTDVQETAGELEGAVADRPKPKSRRGKQQSEPVEQVDDENMHESLMFKEVVRETIPKHPSSTTLDARSDTALGKSQYSYSDAIDEDACASDFTGTIEIRHTRLTTSTPQPDLTESSRNVHRYSDQAVPTAVPRVSIRRLPIAEGLIKNLKPISSAEPGSSKEHSSHNLLHERQRADLTGPRDHRYRKNVAVDDYMGEPLTERPSEDDKTPAEKLRDQAGTINAGPVPAMQGNLAIFEDI